MTRFLLQTTCACLLVILQSGTGLTQEKSASPTQTVTLRVLLPAEDAQLKINGYPTGQNGNRVRLFSTPPLAPRTNYEYTLTAMWEPNNYTKITRTRKVEFRTGADVVVDLNKKDERYPDDIVVRYVPTPPAVVEAMLRLAAVGKDDVVYDLGCGDGRIVIAAVGQFGAKRGVGVDIDPQRIRDSRENASRQNVANRVEFRQTDVLKIDDLSDATVVTLYMGDELNLQLRPILQNKLKPGTRIVSHRFTMGDWKPLKTEKLVDRKGTEYLIHLWKIGE